MAIKNILAKILLSLIIIILIVAIIGICFVLVMTKPSDINAKTTYPVGGMVISNDVDYREDMDKKLLYNPMIRIMQVVWRFCTTSDAKKHESQTPPTNIVEDNNIPYVDDGNKYHQLDVYYPKDYKNDMPLIIDIHGGGWMYGDKELNKYYCLELANKGYVVVNMSYKLVPDTTVDKQLQDISYALKWISNNIDNYPVDKTKVMITGDSAGGMLAVYTAAIQQSENLQNVFGIEKANIEITTLLLTSPAPYMNGSSRSYVKYLWGSDYKEKETYKYMNISDILNDEEVKLPPTYLITSSEDSIAHGQTIKCYNDLQKHGVKCELADYKTEDFNNQYSLPHVFSVLDPFNEAGQTAIDNALDFYKQNCEN